MESLAMQFDGTTGGQDGTSGVYCASVAGSGTMGSSGTIPTGFNLRIFSNYPWKICWNLTSFDDSFLKVLLQIIWMVRTSINGYLVDTDGNLAENDADVDKLTGSLVFADAVNFTEATTTLTMSFNVGEGMSLYDDGSDQITFGSGPFQAIITTD